MRRKVSYMGCDHNCSSCKTGCDKKEFLAPANALSSVKKVIGVVSGKGGVGKSLVTSLLAVTLSRRGYHTAILDADVTGPSIPKMFGVKESIESIGGSFLPAKSKTGIDMISVNLLLENESAPVVWRGPVIAGTIKQFWSDFVWKDIDWMFVDMPPGTGDAPLTVFQSLPVDGVVVVSTPQELVGMIVKKAINMANLMNIPIVGLVENMSYAVCPDCGRKIEIFGKSSAESCGIPVIGRIPIDPELAKLCDRGLIELFEGNYAESAADAIENFTK